VPSANTINIPPLYRSACNTRVESWEIVILNHPKSSSVMRLSDGERFSKGIVDCRTSRGEDIFLAHCLAAELYERLRKTMQTTPAPWEK
jgi:hypothetical protein